MYICPKCSMPLNKCISSYKCLYGHNYDISSKGYVNLLQCNKKSGHGDSKEMLISRRSFLNKGYYYPIIDELCKTVSTLGKSEITALDAGCGEGYYTTDIYNRLSKELDVFDMFGIDVSKDAVVLASRNKKINFAVATINSLPFKNESMDVIFSLFAPLNELEFNRLLKCNGILITVSPSVNHLYGLKKAIYEQPYKNPPASFNNQILKIVNQKTIEYQISLENKNEISDLFKMTPYYHKSSKKDIEKALSLETLVTDIGFDIITYQKTQ